MSKLLQTRTRKAHPSSTRRDFIKGTSLALATVAVSGLPGCAHGRPDSSPAHVIDTHTHFYDPTRPQGVPWPPPNDSLLYRTVSPGDYLRVPTPQPVTGTVVVEASPWLEDNQWLLDLAARKPFIVGVVGNLPAGTPEFSRALNRFAQDRLFRGVRIHGDRLRGGLDDPAFAGQLRSLADHDCSLDLLGGPAMLPAIARLAAAIPHLRIIINHLAGLRIDGGTPPLDWLRDMEAAAAHANVYCKVSGLVEGTGRADGSAPEDAAFYAPVLDSVWNLFGARRLIYGSNWPVSERFASLATIQGIVTDYFNAKGEAALQSVLAGNSRAAYRWMNRRLAA